MSLCQVEDSDPSLVRRLPVQPRLGLQEAPGHLVSSPLLADRPYLAQAW